MYGLKVAVWTILTWVIITATLVLVVPGWNMSTFSVVSTVMFYATWTCCARAYYLVTNSDPGMVPRGWSPPPESQPLTSRHISDAADEASASVKVSNGSSSPALKSSPEPIEIVVTQTPQSDSQSINSPKLRAVTSAAAASNGNASSSSKNGHSASSPSKKGADGNGSPSATTKSSPSEVSSSASKVGDRAEESIEEKLKRAERQLAFCEECDGHKPMRAHHCRVCNRCVLNMDHHCPWVDRCVGQKNRRIFVLFVMYGCLLGYTVLAMCIERLLVVLQEDKPIQSPLGFVMLWLLFAAAVLFSISLMFLFLFQATLVSKNLTTIENFNLYRLRVRYIKAKDNDETDLAQFCQDERDAIKGFDHGALNNLCEVFGKDPKCWLNPFQDVQVDSEWRLRSSNSARSV